MMRELIHLDESCASSSDIRLPLCRKSSSRSESDTVRGCPNPAPTRGKSQSLTPERLSPVLKKRLATPTGHQSRFEISPGEPTNECHLMPREASVRFRKLLD